jgi:hypothetical protein
VAVDKLKIIESLKETGYEIIELDPDGNRMPQTQNVKSRGILIIIIH